MGGDGAAIRELEGDVCVGVGGGSPVQLGHQGPHAGAAAPPVAAHGPRVWAAVCSV